MVVTNKIGAKFEGQLEGPIGGSGLTNGHFSTLLNP